MPPEVTVPSAAIDQYDAVENAAAKTLVFGLRQVGDQGDPRSRDYPVRGDVPVAALARPDHGLHVLAEAGPGGARVDGQLLAHPKLRRLR